MTRRSLVVWARTVVVLALVVGSQVFALQQRVTSNRWITAWGTSQQALGTAAISNATVRMIARVTIGGDAVRIRLDNTYGTSPLVIGKTYVGWRRAGAAVFPGSNRQAFFNRLPEITIPSGGSVESDSIPLQVFAQQDLAVSLYIPGAEVRPSQHMLALTTSYLGAKESGDVAADEAAKPFTGTTTSMLWLKSIDVSSATAAGAIVGLADSITDGTCATLDAHDRWLDWLATRLDLEGRNMAVVNEGIGGNTVLASHPEKIPPTGTPGVDRLERDVLTHAGVTHVILFMGTNDMRRSATAAQVSSGMQDIITRVKARGMKIIGVTAVPRHNNPTIMWDPTKTKVRNELNEWIRTKAPFDAVLDFDKIVRDPANPDLLYPPFDCDGIHPSPRGYYEMGRSVRLDLFGRGSLRTSSR